MVRFNPYSYEFHDDPFPVYKQLRDDAPCYHDHALGFWALSRYADVVAALHDPETYCSRYGITLEDGNPLPMLLTTDPPEQTRLRRLLRLRHTPAEAQDLDLVLVLYVPALAGDSFDLEKSVEWHRSFPLKRSE